MVLTSVASVREVSKLRSGRAWPVVRTARETTKAAAVRRSQGREGREDIRLYEKGRRAKGFTTSRPPKRYIRKHKARVASRLLHLINPGRQQG